MCLFFARKPIIALTLLSLLLSLLSGALSAPLVAQAQDGAIPGAAGVLVTAQAQGIVITYAAGTGQMTAADAATAAAQQLPSLRYSGYKLPMQMLTVEVPPGSTPQIEVQQLVADTLATTPQPEPPETPPALGWEPDPNYVPPTPALPQEPVFIARQGAIRGRQYAVIAVSPIYAQDGVARIVTNLQATVANATPVDAASLMSPAATDEAAGPQPPVDVPVNAAALTNSYKLVVDKPGLQEVLYSQLGLGSEPANLRLTLAGSEVALEKAGDRLRFYVPQVGDRWNATTAYWLTLENGPAITQRAAAPAGATMGAYEQGEWRDSRVYEPGYPGADGDYWFNVDMKGPATLPPGSDVTQSVPATVTISTVLPLRSGTSTYNVISTAYQLPPSANYCNIPYQLHVQGLIGAAVAETKVVDWLPHVNCQRQPTSTAVITSDAALTGMFLRLNPNGYYNTAIKLESVSWRRPVELNFQSIGAGAEFDTDAGAGSLALYNLPGAWQLYDVTQPSRPQIVASGASGAYTLNQAAEAPASRYLLANLAAPQKPSVQSHAPTQFGDVKAADAIYIGPIFFAEELAPLLELRRQQGYTPLFVDVQAIYDVYGYGQISAVAIRNFLRQQSDWQNNARQISVVLAGDATYDPFAYGGIANNTLVAAWMDDVDPYVVMGYNNGEAACDACIAQLNGDDPVTGDNQGMYSWFAADVWMGRLPAQNEQDLKTMVNKLVAYDTSGSESDTWRTRKVILADNYMKALDAQLNATLDNAGDFAELSDNVVNALPNLLGVRRIYYDPAPDREFALSAQGTPIPASNGYYRTVPRAVPEPWRNSNALGIDLTVRNALSEGAGVVTYNGHSNHFYYGRIELNGQGPDKWLFNTNDVSLLSNHRKEFVMLAMTCYTSQYVKPAVNGTIDEWLIRSGGGGAIAVWGPTGLGVVGGHELLQVGFMHQLGKGGEQRIGDLVEAGYTHLLLENGPLDPLMTFLLLGDPLTKARITSQAIYMPVVGR